LPGLGDLPIIGRLFGSQRDSNDRTEIVLSITPRLVRTVQRPPAASSEFGAGTEASFRRRPDTPARAPVQLPATASAAAAAAAARAAGTLPGAPAAGSPDRPVSVPPSQLPVTPQTGSPQSGPPPSAPPPNIQVVPVAPPPPAAPATQQ
jgi:general secretion pathway protein D